MANNSKKSSSKKRNVKVSRNGTHTKIKTKAGTVTVKNNTALKILIALVVIVLIAAIVLTVLHFTGKVDFKALLHISENSSSQTNNGGNNSGGTNNGNQGKTDSNTGSLVTGSGELAIRYMDVGQGDGILIDLPDGKEMLIDCGCKGVTTPYATLKSTYLDKYVEDGIIEYLVLTHSDEDHVKYLDLIFDDFQISNVYMPYILAAPTNTTLKDKISKLDQEKVNMFKDEDTIETAIYSKFFIAALSEPDCQIHINADDDENTTNNVINAEDNTYSITFICPTYEFYQNTSLKNAHAKNAISPVIILEYNTKRFVFTGDCNAYWDSKGNLKTTEGNEWFMTKRIKTLYGETGIDCDVLKVAHHGAEEASSIEFLSVINCEYAVISCGKNNTYNHPRNEALERIKSFNMVVYRTDLNGTVICVVGDDKEIKFSVEKESTQEEAYIGADS